MLIYIDNIYSSEIKVREDEGVELSEIVICVNIYFRSAIVVTCTLCNIRFVTVKMMELLLCLFISLNKSKKQLNSTML